MFTVQPAQIEWVKPVGTTPIRKVFSPPIRPFLVSRHQLSKGDFWVIYRVFLAEHRKGYGKQRRDFPEQQNAPCEAQQNVLRVADDENVEKDKRLRPCGQLVLSIFPIHDCRIRHKRLCRKRQEKRSNQPIDKFSGYHTLKLVNASNAVNRFAGIVERIIWYSYTSAVSSSV